MRAGVYLCLDRRGECRRAVTVSLTSADLPPYEAALQFIKVSDLIRIFQQTGQDVPWSMQNDAVECRYRLDRALGKTRRVWTDAEWDVVVRLRLMGKGSRIT